MGGGEEPEEVSQMEEAGEEHKEETPEGEEEEEEEGEGEGGKEGEGDEEEEEPNNRPL